VNGTLGAFGIEHGGVELTRVRAGAANLASRAQSPNGTVGLALAKDSPLMLRARQAMARADSIRELLANNRGSYGRFKRDSTLLRQVADVRREIDVVRDRLASPNGTLGRFGADSAIFVALNGARHEMTLIMADIRRQPLRYIHF
jgi:hypothetical protein